APETHSLPLQWKSGWLSRLRDPFLPLLSCFDPRPNGMLPLPELPEPEAAEPSGYAAPGQRERLAHAHLELRNLYPGDLARWRFAWPIRPLIAGTMGSILRVRAAGRFRSGGVSGRSDGGSRATFAAARLDVVCALQQHQCGNSVLKDEL